MKRILLFLLLYTSLFGQLNKDRYSVFDRPIEKEAVEYKDRLSTQGVTLTPSQFFELNEAVQTLKILRMWDGTVMLQDANWGVKKDGSNYISTLYNVAHKVGNNSLIGDNGSFNTSVGSWFGVASGTVSLSNGAMLVSGSNGLDFSGARLTDVTTANKAYIITFQCKLNSGVAQTQQIRGPQTFPTFLPTSSWQTFKLQIVGGTEIRFVSNGTSNGSSYLYDDITLQEILNPDLEQSTGGSQPLWVGNAAGGMLSPVNLVANGGGIDATDWTDSNADGLANGMASWFDANPSFSIVTGNGFTGNAQRAAMTGNAKGYAGIKFYTATVGKQYFISVKYRSSVALKLQDDNSLTFATLPINTGNATLYQTSITVSGASGLDFRMNGTSLDYFEIDELLVQEIVQPNLSDNSLATRAVSRYNGTSQYLKIALTNWAQPITVMGVIKQISFTTYDHIWDGYGTSNRMALYQDTPSPVIKQYAGSYGGGNSNLPLNSFGLVKVVYNGTSSLVQINNTTAVTGDAGTNNALGFTLGANTTGSNNSNIESGLLLIYGGTLTAEQEAEWKAFVNRKYRIF